MAYPVFSCCCTVVLGLIVYSLYNSYYVVCLLLRRSQWCVFNFRTGTLLCDCDDRWHGAMMCYTSYYNKIHSGRRFGVVGSFGPAGILNFELVFLLRKRDNVLHHV
jgi:hypothetical protein